MKKVISLFSVLVLVLCINTVEAQQADVDLIIFEPLPEIDFAAFAVTNNLSGAPRILQIAIQPKGTMVVLKGRIDWKEPESGQYKFLFSFETYPFSARTISNDEIGNSNIKVKSTESDNDATEDNIKKGKPTGTYQISVSIYDENGKLLDTDIEELNFLNPAQTLSIRSPEEESTQNIGGVLAEWDEITGTAFYSIRANVRKNTNQSLEEALKSGNPIINDKDVGLSTSVNLRNLLDREWLPGQEIVFQVTANIAGPGGGSQLFSNIVNFRLEMTSERGSGPVNVGLVNLFQNFTDEESARILSLIQRGEINLEDVVISSGDGQVMTLPEFQNLMTYLGTNPDAIINIKFNQK